MILGRFVQSARVWSSCATCPVRRVGVYASTKHILMLKSHQSTRGRRADIKHSTWSSHEWGTPGPTFHTKSTRAHAPTATHAVPATGSRPARTLRGPLPAGAATAAAAAAPPAAAAAARAATAAATAAASAAAPAAARRLRVRAVTCRARRHSGTLLGQCLHTEHDDRRQQGRVRRSERAG